jgi:hypothetical protein
MQRQVPQVVQMQEFRELPTAVKHDLVEENSLCMLGLTFCSSETMEKYKKSLRRKKPNVQRYLCRKLRKCRHSHNMLIHVDAEDQRDLRMAKATKPAEPPDGPRRSPAYDNTRLAVVGVVRAQVVDELDRAEACPLPWAPEEDIRDMQMVNKDNQLAPLRGQSVQRMRHAQSDRAVYR